MKREEAEALVASVVALREGATDQVASTAVAAYPGLHNTGERVLAGTRINWHGDIKKAATDLWDLSGQWPDANPNGWEDLPYKNGIRIIPEVITPGLAFKKGERGWWKDQLYESILPTANVYTPEAYPQGWKKVEA